MSVDERVGSLIVEQRRKQKARQSGYDICLEHGVKYPMSRYCYLCFFDEACRNTPRIYNGYMGR